MKNLILILSFIFIASGINLAQTTQSLTPGIGAATYSGQAITNNNIVALYSAMTTPSLTSAGALTLSTPTVATSSGTLATGVKACQFIPSSNFSGTVNGVTLTSPYDIKLRPIDSYTYPAVPYTVTSGSLTIIPTR